MPKAFKFTGLANESESCSCVTARSYDTVSTLPQPWGQMATYWEPVLSQARAATLLVMNL